MSKIGVWHIQPGGPAKLKEAAIDLEKQLEDWIEKDPNLLQNGLVIVARQLILEGGRLDLLALDPQGRWVIIEIKAGAVRNETIGQGLFYAAVLSRMPYADIQAKVDAYLVPRQKTLETLLKERGVDKAGQEPPREVSLQLVGTHQASGLGQVVTYLVEQYEIPISVVSYDVFQLASGERVLVRELADVEIAPPLRPDGGSKKPARTFEELVKMAEKHGAGHMFRKLKEAADAHGLHHRLYASSIMYAPPQNHTRMLFTVWVTGKEQGVLKTYIGSEVFAEYFQVSEEKAIALLGSSGYREMNQSVVEQFIAGLDELFAGMQEENA